MNATAKTVGREDFTRIVEPDPDPDTSYLEQAGWEDDLAKYRRGDFGYVGVRASVVLLLPWGEQGGGITHRVTSPGLWGIEDRSTDEYLDGVFQDECEVLAEMLAELGHTVTD